MKRIFLILFLFFFTSQKTEASNEISIYEKIDLFGEVFDKINKEYVEEIN